MTEIAQLTAVQSQTSLNAEEQTVAADSMLGRTVTGTGTNGQSLSGTVTGVLLSSSGRPHAERDHRIGSEQHPGAQLDQHGVLDAHQHGVVDAHHLHLLNQPQRGHHQRGSTA